MISLSKPKTRLLRLLHRQGGIVLAVFLILFAISGVLLNHTEDFGLADRPVPAAVASRYYQSDGVDGFVVDRQYIYAISGTLYIGRNAVGNCEGGLRGSVSLGDFLAALCGDELILATPTGELVERLSAAHGVPADIEGIGFADGALVVALPEGNRIFDTVSLDLKPLSADAVMSTTVAVPSSVVMSDSVSWEQFVLDLHSGKYFGGAGVWLADLLALALMLLGLTGIVMWLLPRPRNGDCRNSDQG